ncbi:toxin [Pseudomonas sp. CVAP|uniref:RHS repeat-associated core domain-containing protein n=1 Tax=Pseudomonas sp. CVAP\|nr:RHS repeat-associated core domain-containing protein [Pseudomonas sp. CVAP\
MNLQVHRHTPTLKVNDGRGLPIRHVQYLRKVIEGPVTPLVTRKIHDSIGRLIAQWDPRLFGTAEKPNLFSVHGLSGEALQVDSVDAGMRLNLIGVAGQALQRWDGRGCHWQTDYDNQLRVIALHEQPPGQPQTAVERSTYADHLANPDHNLRGQKTTLEDPAGRLDLAGFSLLGAPLRETRTFLDGKTCTTAWHYSANGAELTRTDAAGHRQHTRFGLAGQLKQSFLQLKDGDSLQPIVQGLTYNAFAHIETKTAGNGVVSTWTYDPADGRLTSQTAGVPGQSLLQNLSYHYDRMGNILRIEDHGFKPVFFANQRVDGDRDFAYDSLYRLTRASGLEVAGATLQPGLPELITPIDTGRLLNYTEQYDYDHGDNLTWLCHQREGNCYTHHMRIDPTSNRGLAWKEGDPEPVFDESFDAHGNQRMLQAGQPLTWNHRDQLNIATLIDRGTGLNDEETYAYSQGVRVHKQLTTQARSISHKCDVYYLPGLEIRTLNNTQELHVITLHGNVRYLHWALGKPKDIDNNQLRYSLDDHLGSSTLELDHDGAVISHELYYPFGGTCWWAARSVVEADYKTIRYSGKEMDVSGLYYYGQRYYAPWLQRWISADPGGDVDGLNLYRMAGNNPMLYVDRTGGMKNVSEIVTGTQDVLNQAANYADAVDKHAHQFDGLVPEGAFTPEEKKDLTLWKFARSKSGKLSFRWGAGIGLSAGAAIGGLVGMLTGGPAGAAVGGAIGGFFGVLIGGAIGIAARYFTYKHGVKVAETLGTDQIKNATRGASNAANDLANGKLPEALEQTLNSMADETIGSLLKDLEPLSRLRAIEMLKNGITPSEVFEQLKDSAKEQLDQTLEGLKDQAAELGNSAANLSKEVALMFDEAGKVVLPEALGSSSGQRPIPKPRARKTLETTV